MEALVLKRSSLVIPGLRGTPAGITTTSAPVRASARPSLERGGQAPGCGRFPVNLALEGIYSTFDKKYKLCFPRRIKFQSSEKIPKNALTWLKSAETPGVPTTS